MAIFASIAVFRIPSVLPSQCVPRDEVGTMSGAVDALDALCRVIAPVLSGVMMQYVGEPRVCPKCAQNVQAIARYQRVGRSLQQHAAHQRVRVHVRCRLRWGAR